MTRIASLRRQFALGVTAQGYAQLVNIGSQLVVLPVMLWLWGPERYGAWLIISALPTYLSMADLGFAQVAANEMTMLVARGARDRARAISDTAWAMILGVSVLAIVAFGLFLAVVPIGRVFNFPESVVADAPLACLALLGTVVLSLVLGVIGAGFRATGRYGVMVASAATIRLVDLVALVVAAAAGGSFLQVAVTILIVKLTATTIVAVSFARQTPWLRPGLALAELPTARRLLVPSFGYLSFSLSNALNIQGVTLVVGALLGPTAVVTVSAIRTLTRLGVQAAAVINHTMAVVYSPLFGRGDTDRFRQVFRTHVAAGAAGAIVYLVGYLLLGDWVLALWTHGKVGDYGSLLAGMTIAIAAEVVWFTLQSPYLATNRHMLFAPTYLGFSIAGLLITWQALQLWGIEAVGLTSAAISIAFVLVTVVIVLRVPPHPAREVTR
jgi:O-antigen/teichoic acid export membrane protein